MSRKRASAEPLTNRWALPDVAYIVRPGEDNEELRYSIRSIATNLTSYQNLWICGFVPSWLQKVSGISLPPVTEKFANMRQSLTALCSADGVAGRVVVMCDDIYLLEPRKALELPVCHLGTVTEYISRLLNTRAVGSRNTWLDGMGQTGAWLGPDTLAYEAHTPLLMDTEDLSDALADYPANVRLAYPELYALAGAGPEGSNVGNAKVAGVRKAELDLKLAQDMPYLSSNDLSFRDGAIGMYIRDLFPEPSKYEVAP